MEFLDKFILFNLGEKFIYIMGVIVARYVRQHSPSASNREFFM